MLVGIGVLLLYRHQKMVRAANVRLRDTPPRAEEELQEANGSAEQGAQPAASGSHGQSGLGKLNINKIFSTFPQCNIYIVCR